jgi:hypothetical protein
MDAVWGVNVAIGITEFAFSVAVVNRRPVAVEVPRIALISS